MNMLKSGVSCYYNMTVIPLYITLIKTNKTGEKSLYNCLVVINKFNYTQAQRCATTLITALVLPHSKSKYIAVYLVNIILSL